MCLNLLSKVIFVTACEGSSLDLHSLVVELEMLLKGRQTRLEIQYIRFMW